MGRGRRRLSASLLLLAGCTRAPSPTTVTPPPIPLEAFFANRDTTYDHKVSPDGTRLAWIGMAEGRLTVHVRRLDGDDVVALDTHSRRSIQSFVWAQDSRRILYGQDRDGDENTHVFVADPRHPARACSSASAPTPRGGSRCSRWMGRSTRGRWGSRRTAPGFGC